MLKLTLYEDGNRTIYIAAKAIQSMVRGLGDKGTHVRMDHMEHVVCERPEEIFAMPEMRAEIDKAMLATLPPMKIEKQYL